MAFVMRYGHQQLSEIKQWQLDDLFRFYERLNEIVKVEFGVKR